MTKPTKMGYQKKGMIAYKRGKKRSENPYNFESEKGHDWDDGWLMAQAVSRRKR